MDVITLLVWIVVLGIVLWLVETYVPMSPPIQVLLRIVVVMLIVLWLVRFFFGHIPVPRL